MACGLSFVPLPKDLQMLGAEPAVGPAEERKVKIL